MIRWPMRRSRGNSNERRNQTPDLAGSREPKKSILRSKGGDNDLYNSGRGYYNSSASMIDIRVPKASVASINSDIYDSVTGDFASGRSTREKRSVLFLDQLVRSRQASFDSSNDTCAYGNAERLGGRLCTPSPSFSSYPTSYQPSPTPVRRDSSVPAIELISKTSIASRRESIDATNGDGTSVGNRFALRPSLPWARKKSRQLDSPYSENYGPGTATTGSSTSVGTYNSRRMDPDAISRSSSNLRMDRGPVNKASLDKSTCTASQHSAYNNTVSGYNMASKPPLPTPVRETSSPQNAWGLHPRIQDARVSNNCTANCCSPRPSVTNAPRQRMYLPYQHSSSGNGESPSSCMGSEDNTWTLHPPREVEPDRPYPPGAQKPQIISRPRVNNKLVDMQQPSEPSAGTRLRRRVTLEYASSDPLPNGHHNSPSTVTPDAPRIIEIVRRTERK